MMVAVTINKSTFNQEFCFIIKDVFTSWAMLPCSSQRPWENDQLLTQVLWKPRADTKTFVIMVVLECPAPGCTYKTADLQEETSLKLLSLHALAHAQTPTPSSFPGPKLNRPSIDAGVDEEAWNAFIRRWETFKIGSGISSGAAPSQFFQCTSDNLGDLILKADPNVISKPIES